MNWRTSTLVFIDTETTGTDPSTARIVELAIRAVTPTGHVAHDWLINPGEPIPPESSAIHGIVNGDVANAPLFYDIAATVHMLASTGIPVAYNARFDRAMLIAEFLRAGCDMPQFLRSGAPWIDPLTWVRKHEPYAKGAGRHKLTTIAQRWGITPGTAHRAAGDVETTHRVLEVLASVKGLMPDTLDELITQQKILAAEHELDFQRWLAKQPKKEAT